MQIVTDMAEAEEFRCFVGGLSWNTTDKGLEDEFRHFGNVLEAKVWTCAVFLFLVMLLTCDAFCARM